MKLTREQIENMPVGREMDLAIVQEFMGLDIYDAIEWLEWAWKYNELSYPCGFYDEFGVFIVTAEGTMGKYFSPSTDIAAAWEVVDTFDRVFWDISIQSFTDNDGEIWEAYFHEYFPDSSGRHGKGLALTAPLAICRAALIAMMEEK